MNYKIVSWNVAGLRAMLKKDSFHEFMQHPDNDYTIISLQETKCESHQAPLPQYIIDKYPHRYWKHCDGKSQRKGLNGVTIWSKIMPLDVLDIDFDNEGRFLVMDFEHFKLINVYTPNSQQFENERYYFRQAWNNTIINYISTIQNNKPIIFCGDFNVCNETIDVVDMKSKINKYPGCFDIEREQFKELLKKCNLIDTFRHLNPELQKFTYWSNFLKQPRSNENGWRIDYFLCSPEIIKNIKVSDTRMDVKGSDHCPIYIECEFY